MSQTVGEAHRKPGISHVWLEKYAVFRQTQEGELVNLDFMLLNEVIPFRVEDLYHVKCFRGSETEPFVTFGSGNRLSFVNEWLLDRKARSHDSAEELDASFPNTSYRYRIEDAKGIHELTLSLGGAEGITSYPSVPRLKISQPGCLSGKFDYAQDITIQWSAFETIPGPAKELPLFAENTIFVLIDNCRGETVYTSGSGNKNERMSPLTTQFKVPAQVLEPGMRYTVFVCFIKIRASDSVTVGDAVISGVAVNSAVTELAFQTAGEARNSRECPPIEMRANYRWPGKLRSDGELLPWPIDDSGLFLSLDRALRSGIVLREMP
jgi:hypothetical protein